ncbi:hypothetical protein [Deinococcus soli (ex Cha et al. 2016)]|uniref:hypothetical protein n=1 Tax=Deinococcus soli (ex Cha et al. 2016) TaxID=1309411 RepID=UPI001669A8AB|nr:hypothetical protein [Deinococcus soli (ex Cha et al. 2016)]GGB79533.1 hypothetical protein GCM10008019_39710 [Deinococcus soli (ex Cha et al. 2016)]
MKNLPPLTEQPAQLHATITRLTDLLDLASIDTRAVQVLLAAGALPEAAELACDCARDVPGVQTLRIETATLAAIAYTLRGAGPLQA